jgi:hypothetical protein
MENAKSPLILNLGTRWTSSRFSPRKSEHEPGFNPNPGLKVVGKRETFACARNQTL